MKDFKGNELAVGDKIITYHNKYAGFVRGEIVDMTAKTVKIKLNADVNDVYMHGQTRRFPVEVIKDS